MKLATYIYCAYNFVIGLGFSSKRLFNGKEYKIQYCPGVLLYFVFMTISYVFCNAVHLASLLTVILTLLYLFYVYQNFLSARPHLRKSSSTNPKEDIPIKILFCPFYDVMILSFTFLGSLCVAYQANKTNDPFRYYHPAKFLDFFLKSTAMYCILRSQLVRNKEVFTSRPDDLEDETSNNLVDGKSKQSSKSASTILNLKDKKKEFDISDLMLIGLHKKIGKFTNMYWRYKNTGSKPLNEKLYFIVTYFEYNNSRDKESTEKIRCGSHLPGTQAYFGHTDLSPLFSLEYIDILVEFMCEGGGFLYTNSCLKKYQFRVRNPSQISFCKSITSPEVKDYVIYDTSDGNQRLSKESRQYHKQILEEIKSSPEPNVKYSIEKLTLIMNVEDPENRGQDYWLRYILGINAICYPIPDNSPESSEAEKSDNDENDLAEYSENKNHEQKIYNNSKSCYFKTKYSSLSQNTDIGKYSEVVKLNNTLSGYKEFVERKTIQKHMQKNVGNKDSEEFGTEKTSKINYDQKRTDFEKESEIKDKKYEDFISDKPYGVVLNNSEAEPKGNNYVDKNVHEDNDIGNNRDKNNSDSEELTISGISSNTNADHERAAFEKKNIDSEYKQDWKNENPCDEHDDSTSDCYSNSVLEPIFKNFVRESVHSESNRDIKEDPIIAGENHKISYDEGKTNFENDATTSVSKQNWKDDDFCNEEPDVSTSNPYSEMKPHNYEKNNDHKKDGIEMAKAVIAIFICMTDDDDQKRADSKKYIESKNKQLCKVSHSSREEPDDSSSKIDSQLQPKNNNVENNDRVENHKAGSEENRITGINSYINDGQERNGFEKDLIKSERTQNGNDEDSCIDEPGDSASDSYINSNLETEDNNCVGNSVHDNDRDNGEKLAISEINSKPYNDRQRIDFEENITKSKSKQDHRDEDFYTDDREFDNNNNRENDGNYEVNNVESCEVNDPQAIINKTKDNEQNFNVEEIEYCSHDKISELIKHQQTEMISPNEEITLAGVDIDIHGDPERRACKESDETLRDKNLQDNIYSSSELSDCDSHSETASVSCFEYSSESGEKNDTDKNTSSEDGDEIGNDKSNMKVSQHDNNCCDTVSSDANPDSASVSTIHSECYGFNKSNKNSLHEYHSDDDDVVNPNGNVDRSVSSEREIEEVKSIQETHKSSSITKPHELYQNVEIHQNFDLSSRTKELESQENSSNLEVSDVSNENFNASTPLPSDSRENLVSEESDEDFTLLKDDEICSRSSSPVHSVGEPMEENISINWPSSKSSSDTEAGSCTWSYPLSLLSKATDQNVSIRDFSETDDKVNDNANNGGKVSTFHSESYFLNESNKNSLHEYHSDDDDVVNPNGNVDRSFSTKRKIEEAKSILEKLMKSSITKPYELYQNVEIHQNFDPSSRTKELEPQENSLNLEVSDVLNENFNASTSLPSDPRENIVSEESDEDFTLVKDDEICSRSSSPVHSVGELMEENISISWPLSNSSSDTEDGSCTLVLRKPTDRNVSIRDISETVNKVNDNANNGGMSSVPPTSSCIPSNSHPTLNEFTDLNVSISRPSSCCSESENDANDSVDQDDDDRSASLGLNESSSQWLTTVLPYFSETKNDINNSREMEGDNLAVFTSGSELSFPTEALHSSDIENEINDNSIMIKKDNIPLVCQDISSTSLNFLPKLEEPSELDISISWPLSPTGSCTSFNLPPPVSESLNQRDLSLLTEAMHSSDTENEVNENTEIIKKDEFRLVSKRNSSTSLKFHPKLNEPTELDVSVSCKEESSTGPCTSLNLSSPTNESLNERLSIVSHFSETENSMNTGDKEKN